MPFGLKNAGATYQRLVNKIFKPLIGRTMEVYIDDMLVKSLNRSDHVKDLREAFSILQTYGLKLNPEKCTFGVESGKFLGYLVSQRGIEVNPDQIQAIMKMNSPRTIKEVQALTRRIAALNRFISRASDKCQPFFQTLKKNKDFKRTESCEEAFIQLKTCLMTPPLLSKPNTGEDLFLYLAVSANAVSAALIREETNIQNQCFM